MDLNYVFLRQQIERARAESAASAAARDAHEEMARQYELQIERHSAGRIAFPWHREPDATDPGSDQLISELPTPSTSS